MASEKILAMIEEVKGLSVLELNELVKALEEEFGVSLFSFYNGVFRREVVLDIDAQLRRGQVADMTHRGDYLIAGSEIFFNCLRLCGRLDYN